MDKFKLAIILAYFALAFVGTAAVVLIMVFRPDATATIINYVGTIMGIASTGAVTFWMLQVQGKKIEEVKVQTNGANSALREENAQLTAQLLAVVGSAPSQQPGSRWDALNTRQPPAVPTDDSAGYIPKH